MWPRPTVFGAPSPRPSRAAGEDKFGFSWQISPDWMDDVYINGSPEAIRRVTHALLPMKKLNFAALEKVYRGECVSGIHLQTPKWIKREPG